MRKMKKHPRIMMEEIEIKIDKKKHKKPSAKERKMEKVMHEFKEGDLPIGKSNKKVKSRAQAIAIGLSEARNMGKKKRK